MRAPILIALLGIALVSCGPGGTVALRVQVVIPANAPSIEAGELHLSLWSYDPGIADVGATLTGTDHVPFAHVVGERNVFLMRVVGHVSGGWRYYITVEGCQSTPDGPVAVLWDGIEGVAAPHVVEMQYRTTPSSCQAPRS